MGKAQNRRVVAILVTLITALNQYGFTKPRWISPQPAPPPGCKVGARQLKKVVDAVMARPAMITDAERAFARQEHERLSCTEYTRLYERSDYYKSPDKRKAMARWHRETYHARKEGAHEASGQGSDADGNR